MASYGLVARGSQVERRVLDNPAVQVAWDSLADKARPVVPVCLAVVGEQVFLSRQVSVSHELQLVLGERFACHYNQHYRKKQEALVGQGMVDYLLVKESQRW